MYNEDDDVDYIPAEKNTPTDDYDPQEMLRKTAKVQSGIVDAIGGISADAIARDPKLLESVSTFLNGVNNTAVQVTRNKLVESSTNIDLVVDAVVQRLNSSGQSTIRTARDGGQRGTIPSSDSIKIDAPLPEDPRMMDRGLVQITFDEFAENNDIKVNDD